MKHTELLNINALAFKTAIDGMHGTQWLENELFDLVVKYGEIGIAEDNIYFYIEINGINVDIISLTIFKEVDGDEIEIDCSELMGRIEIHLAELKRFENECRSDEDLLRNIY